MKDLYKLFLIAVIPPSIIIGIYSLVCMIMFPEFYRTGNSNKLEYAASDIKPVATTVVENSSSDMLFSVCARASFAITTVADDD